MKVVNTTPAVDHLELTTIDRDAGMKAARLLAKLTFELDGRSIARLAERDQVPVLTEDVATAWGTVPADTNSFEHDGVEVIVHGAAHAAEGRPVPQMLVSLTLGDAIHRALVSGDRQWIGQGEGAQPSAPVPFLRMPLTYERAYGGSVDVWIDEESTAAVAHPGNPAGRGFDPAPAVAQLVETLGMPDGYPLYDRSRWLPNVEDLRTPVREWSDVGRPYCWAGRPVHVPGPAYDETGPREATSAGWVETSMRVRCHPDLLLATLPHGMPIVARGMSPGGELAFWLPVPRVVMDYEIDGRTGSRALRPRRLLLLTEERRFALTYEDRVRFRALDYGERSLRLRVEDP